jgi:glyoxalase family protein
MSEEKRFGDKVLSFSDPDGMRIELIGHANAGEAHAARSSDVPSEHAIRGFFGVTLWEESVESTAIVLQKMGFSKTLEEGNRTRFSAPGNARGRHRERPWRCKSPAFSAIFTPR